MLDMTKVKHVVAYMILKTEMEVDQDYTVFNYGLPRPQKYSKSQDRIIVEGTGMKPIKKLFYQGTSKRKWGRKPSQMR